MSTQTFIAPIEVRPSDQSITVYANVNTATAGDVELPVATLIRRRVYEKGPAWKLYAIDGAEVRTFSITPAPAIFAALVRRQLVTYWERMYEAAIGTMRPLGVRDEDLAGWFVIHHNDPDTDEGFFDDGTPTWHPEEQR